MPKKYAPIQVYRVTREPGRLLSGSGDSHWSRLPDARFNAIHSSREHATTVWVERCTVGANVGRGRELVVSLLNGTLAFEAVEVVESYKVGSLEVVT